MEIKFCTACGSPTQNSIPEDDDHIRAVCSQCGQIHYSNPKMVVGTIPIAGGKILLCRRNIEPQKNMWTLPAGFLEDNETVQAGALRETFEETQATAEIIAPYRLINIPVVSQMYFMFRARLTSDRFGPTKESSEVKLFDEKDIPWDKIAFKSIQLTLEHYLQDKKAQKFPFKIFDIN